MYHIKDNIFRKLFVARYSTLNGQDSSQLEDWLTDIETASELTGESRTKLAQAKSRGLVRTLISEVLTAQKTWEEIQDYLYLKKFKCRHSHIN